jgi:YHS domain-containing protein
MVMKLLDAIRGRRTAIDPVCGMTVDRRNPPGGTAEHEGTTYYFCGPGCRLSFEEDPVGYLSGEKREEM